MEWAVLEVWVASVEQGEWVVLAERAAWVAAGTRSIHSAAEGTRGATTHNIVAVHHIVTAQLLTDLEAQHAEIPLQIGRRAREIRFQDRVEISQVIELAQVRVQMGVAAA